MPTIPMLGLHIVFPPLAVTRWCYKASRIEHANLDLVEVADTFEAALPTWTVDDFADTDPKVAVHRAGELSGPVHVYEHVGFAPCGCRYPTTRRSVSRAPCRRPPRASPSCGSCSDRSAGQRGSRGRSRATPA